MTENIDSEKAPGPLSSEQIVDHLRMFRDITVVKNALDIMKEIGEKLSVVHLYKENMRQAIQMPQPYGNHIFHHNANLIKQVLRSLQQLHIPVYNAAPLDHFDEPPKDLFEGFTGLQPHLQATVITLHSQQAYTMYQKQNDETAQNPSMANLIKIASKSAKIKTEIFTLFGRIKHLLLQVVEDGNQMENPFGYDSDDNDTDGDDENAEPAMIVDQRTSQVSSPSFVA